MPLTDQQIKALKPDPNKTQKHFDGGGLYIEVPPNGNKRWRLKYRFAGKEKLLSFGLYPRITLKEARQLKEDAKRKLANNVDPSAQKQAERKAATCAGTNTFEFVALELLTVREGTQWSHDHAKTILLRLRKDAFPALGQKSIGDITARDILDLLRRIEVRGALETAHRVLTIIGQVFDYAIVTERTASNPTNALRQALRPAKAKHLAAVTDPARFGEILRMMDGYRGGEIVAAALRLAPLVFVRPGELRHAEWASIDLDSGEWRFIASKTNADHIVPLSQQAITVLRDLKPFTGTGRYVFPNPRTKERPMSENAVLAALRGLGISKEEMCGHGLRATARTLLDEKLEFPPHLIEQQLAHSVRDPLGRAYNRTTHLPQRKKMMQRWADYLDELRRN
jgi:integrase